MKNFFTSFFATLTALLVFLASDESALVTGNMHSCDGGMTI